jgi:uncharacterized protein (DUF58 family)
MSKETMPKHDFDWNELGTLRLRARAIADGLYVGIHRSARRGVGVEFGGRRNYVPGDDLRWLDRHALMRHGKLLVREFETETDRLFYLVIDATASMTYRSPQARVSKWDYASTTAAALSRIALAAGDPIALDWIGGSGTRWLPAMSSRQAFDRILAALSATKPGGKEAMSPLLFERSLVPVTRYAKRGAIVVVFTDLIDLPAGAIERLSELSGNKRSLIVVRVLDPAECDFPFTGATRFVSLEGRHYVDTDASLARAKYLENLATATEQARALIEQRGGRLYCANTIDSPVTTVRSIVELIGAIRS